MYRNKERIWFRRKRRLWSVWSQFQLCLTPVHSSIIISARPDHEVIRAVQWFDGGVSKGGTFHQRLMFVPQDFKVLNRSDVFNVTLKCIVFPLDYVSCVILQTDGGCIWTLCGVEICLSTKQLNNENDYRRWIKAFVSNWQLSVYCHLCAVIWMNSPFINITWWRADELYSVCVASGNVFTLFHCLNLFYVKIILKATMCKRQHLWICTVHINVFI